MAFLDGPELQQVIDMVDYLDKGNRIVFEYLILWQRQGRDIFSKVNNYNLLMCLSHVYNLFVRMPPVSFEELFGAPQEAEEPLNNMMEDPQNMNP